MTQAAKAQEPSMEEILASIRRIIADDDNGKPAKAATAADAAPAPKQPAAAAPAAPARPPAPAPAPPAKPAAPPAPPRPAASAAAANSQDEIDAMLAELDGPPKATPKPAAPQPAAGDVLDLTESMAAPTPPPGPAPSFRTIDASPDVVFTNKPEAPAPSPDRGLISAETVKAVDSAFNTLAHTVIGQNARTLEDLVREMLRPMLKSWLDDNLPGLVERIVRAEIERVSRGRP
jgi:cell pole-organizing protein PopZ